MKKIKESITLTDLIDRDFGVKGTPKRDDLEREIQLELMSEQIKQLRKARNLTQSQLGELVGVKKSQISRLEKEVKNVTIGTILRVFSALNTNIKLKLEIEDNKNLGLV